MDLNLKDIQLRLCKVIQVTIDTSYTFIRKHPVLSGASLVSFIPYIFLSYIYSFLVFLSPFLFCTAILIKVFWSSEQTQLRYVGREEIKRREQQKRNELQRYPKTPKHVEKRVDTVFEKRYNYSKQHALSRRRNFRDKRILDVVSDIDENSKAISTASNNRISADSSTEKKELGSASGKEEDSSASAGKLRLRSEPSMSDLVEAADLGVKSSIFDGVDGFELEDENMEDGDYEDEEEAQEDRHKAVEWTEDDQKNLMDLGISEIERNKRLESLIARRRARKLLKLQIENGLIDIRNVNPNQLAPLFINSLKQPVDSLKDFDGFEMPGSAPSVLPPSRNPFDLPYDPSEEKPILRGDSFDQEFKAGLLKDMTYCRHESFSLGPSFPVESRQDQVNTDAYSFFNGTKASEKLGQQRFRRLPADKGKHDWLIDQLFSKGDHRMPPSIGDKHDEVDKSEVKPPNPLRNKEVIKYEVVRENTKEIGGEGEENDLVIKSMIEDRSEPDIKENSNYGFADIGQEISNVHYLEKRIFHTPICSIASDLHVELSEIGSVDETNTTTDGESAVYDGDIDKDILTSGSEDMGGASFNSRAVHRIIEEDLAEVEKTLKDASSYTASEQIDEANAADVSSGETPTYGIQCGNFFWNIKKDVLEIEEPQLLNSADVSSSPDQKQLIDISVHRPLHEIHSENLECGYPSENLKNEVKAVNNVNDLAAIENDDSKNLQSIEDPSTSNVQQELVDEFSANSSSSKNLQSIEDPSTSNVQQELVDEFSANSSSSVSLQSVLPEKTPTDQSSSSAFDQLIHADVPQSDTEDMTLMTSNGELPPKAIPQNMQSFMNDSTVQSQHDGIFSNPQEASFQSEMSDDASILNALREHIFDEPKMVDDPSTSNILSKSVFDDVEENNISESPPNTETADTPENSIQDTNNFDKVNEVIVNDKQDKVKLKYDDQNNEDRSTIVVRQDTFVESPRLAEMTTMDAGDEKSRELVGNKATIEPSKMTRENDSSTTTEDNKMSGSVTMDETKLYHGNHDDDSEADIEAKQGVHVDFLNLKEHEEVRNPEKPEAETDSVNSPVEEVPSNSLKSESSLEVSKLNIENESPSVGQEAAEEPFITTQATSSSSAKDIEGKHDELNKNESIISPGSAVDINKLSKVVHTKQPEELAQLDKSEEMRYLQNEPKELVEADIENDEMTSDNITKDLPQPITTEVSNSSSTEDTEGKFNEVNEKEAIKEELEKNETMVSSTSVGEDDKLINTAYIGEPGELEQPKVTNRSEGEGYVQSEPKKLVEEDKEKHKLETVDINKDSSQPTTTSTTIFNVEANKGHASSS